MVRGLYAAASGMLVAQSQVDAIANNLANANTGGFKRTLLQVEAAPTLDVYRMQTDPGRVAGRAVPGVPVSAYVGPLGTGARIYDTPSLFAQGPLQATGNSLDLAIAGPNGFFSVQTPRGVRYTRDGEFVRNANGDLATQDGNLVLGTGGGPLNLPPGAFDVAADGTITQQGGRVIGRVSLTQFANLTALRPEGDTLFADTGAARPAPAAGVSVQQGYLEKSTTSVVRSMVALITAERWFEAGQKAVQTQDDATQQAITTVAKTTP